MKLVVLLTLLAAFALTQTPPLWPVRFQQDFVESYSSTPRVTAGKLYYDTERNMERFDRTSGMLVPICSTIINEHTPCWQLTRDAKRYVIFPLKRHCCMCCDAAHGCGLVKRDWLKNAKFAGKEDIAGQTFNKFVDTDGQIDYWATTDSVQIPRKLIEGGKLTKDWIMNTYSEEPIPDSIFALPDYCSPTNLCPSTSKCGQFQ